MPVYIITIIIITRLRSFSGALRALQFCEALACGASEVRKLRGEVEKSVAKLDDTMHTMAVQIVQIVHTQHAYRTLCML